MGVGRKWGLVQIKANYLYQIRTLTHMLATTTLITTKSFTLAVYQKGSTSSKRLALVLPGRLDTKDYAHMRSHVDLLASKGYFAVSFDPPGTWESKGDLSIYSATNYIKAIKELIDYFGNRPTILAGHSRGAGMATIAGTRFEEVIGFVSIMGKASYKSKKDPKWEKDGSKIHTRDTPLEYAERTKTFDLSYDFVRDSWQYDATDDLKVCKKPKLFVAGDKDALVSLSVIEEIYNISAEPKKLVVLNSGHDYRKDEKLIEEVNELIGEFIAHFDD